MNTYAYVVVAWILATAAISLIAAALSKSKWARLAIAAIFIVVFGITFAAPFELIGQPKPRSWAWLERNVENPVIRGYELHEGEAIYLMLSIERGKPPRLYRFPWNQQDAEDLMQAMQQGQKQGTDVVLAGKPFEGASPFDAIAETIGDIVGDIFGEGEGKGEGDGEMDGEGEGGNFDNSVEDRKSPFAHPRPQEAQPEKPRDDEGLIYDRPK